MIPGNAPAEVGDQRDGGGWSALGRVLDEVEDLHPELRAEGMIVEILDEHAAACFRTRPPPKCAPAR